MTSKEGHEPQDLDEAFVKAQLRQGGALVQIRVEACGQVWIGKHLLSAGELTSSHLTATKLIQLVTHRLVDTLDIGETPQESSV